MVLLPIALMQPARQVLHVPTLRTPYSMPRHVPVDGDRRPEVKSSRPCRLGLADYCRVLQILIEIEAG